MPKCYILYNEVWAEENPVQCIYLDKDECHAQIVGKSPYKEESPYYKPTEDEMKRLCKNEKEFLACPRYAGYQNHLRALNLQK